MYQYSVGSLKIITRNIASRELLKLKPHQYAKFNHLAQGAILIGT